MKKLSGVLSKIIICTLAICFGMSFFSGCSSSKSDGYFTYIELKDDKIGLTGLTKSGQEQEVIVIPQYIKGKEVISFDNTSSSIMPRKQNKWESSKLKKVFIPFSINFWHNPFEKISSLNKTILMGSNASITSKAYLQGNAGVDENQNNKSRTYVFFEGADSWGSNTYRPANISYMWNIEENETAFNNNWYWIDDEEYGSKIGYIPANPDRAGFEFGGWFKEPECINEWNFETYTLPEAIMGDFTNEHGITAQYPTLQRTILYAKWQEK